MNKLAPIVLFVYDRPWHTQQTIEALQKNDLAIDSELIIYSDGPKDKDSLRNIEAVRKFLKSVKGFKKVTIIERENNWGLANSIIEGVTEIVSKYGKIIVLEDDLVTSQYFLRFMNEALEFYKNEKMVWHISGWNYPIKSNELEDVFLWRGMNCWGWGTWNNKWKYFEKDATKLINELSKKEIKKFNIDGCQNFWKQVIDNKNSKIDTWAVFWYAIIFKHNALCINPFRSFVVNIGMDGSGSNCNANDFYQSKLNYNSKIKMTSNFIENIEALDEIKKFNNSIKPILLLRNKVRYQKKTIWMKLNYFCESLKSIINI